MNKYILPTSVEINGVECKFNTDYRDILYLFEIFNDPDLLDGEKVYIALENFYITDDYLKDLKVAVKSMMEFITMNDEEQGHKESKPLFDWEQDFSIIVSPINKHMGVDVRGLDYLHWWTFLSAFMEIGECTFNTYVGIRDKLNRGKKLEKTEELIYKEHREKIVLKKRYDSATQALIDEILGKE